MYVNPGPVSIDTTICIATIENTRFDFESIFNNVNIDNEILGIKYHDNVKGNIKNNGAIFNQITFKMYIISENKVVNIKAFINGKFQISGVKNKIQAKKAVKLFLNKIKNIYGTLEVPIVIKDNIIYNKSEYESKEIHSRFNYIKIYGKNENNEYIIIGHQKKVEFTIYNFI